MANKPEIPHGLPIIEAACDAADLVFGAGDGFWLDLDERVAAFGLAAVLDQALAGRSAPRVWVLVHEPGQPQLAAAAALGLARALADRGQAALVIDGDDHSTALSRWAGRDNEEGWIDIARYGTSVLTSGVALPFAGRAAYLLGVGSYAPTDATDQEIEHLITRLRRQADDLLVVLPGGAHAAPWARKADIRLLCHDQAVLTPSRLGAVVANLTDAGVAPTALLGFGRQVEAAAPPVKTAAAPETDPPAVVEVEASRETGVAAALAAAEVSDRAADATGAEFARRRGTSSVFWLVAVTATVLIACVAFYYFRYVRVPDGDVFGDTPTMTRQEQPVPATATGQATIGGDPEPLTTAPTETRALTDTVVVATGADLAGTEPQPTVTADPPPQATGQTIAQATEPTPAAAAQPSADPVFDPVPYQVPVGRDGWALQVYSFRDSTSANEEIARLGRRGLKAAVRIVELPDSGRWWRIYVGSYASRNEARAAEPALFARLRTDWAQPTRFTVAVTDTAGH